MANVRFIEFSPTFVKPSDGDILAVYAIQPNLQQGIEYGTLKSFFVRTDEDHDINASHEYQSGDSLSWGSAGEFKIYSNGVDAFINSKSGIKQRYQVNGSDFVVFDGTNNCIKVGNRAINYTGAPESGLVFTSLNKGEFRNALDIYGKCRHFGGIAMFGNAISWNGNVDRGINFTNEDVIKFNNNVSTNNVYINELGTDGKGLSFTDGDANFDQTVTCQENIRIIAAGSQAVYANGTVRSDAYFQCGVFDGISPDITLIDGIRNNGGVIEYSTRSLVFHGGILTYQQDYPLWITA